MVREAVNPDMELISDKAGGEKKSTNPSSVVKEPARIDVNPPMDLKTHNASIGARTGGSIDAPRRKDVNPDMILSRDKAGGEPQADEREGAVAPDVGAVPTGMKASKKVEKGQG